MSLPTLVLIPSPLVGRSTWVAVAGWLLEQGREVLIVDTGAPRRPDDVVAAVVQAASELGPATLVPHSNAGLYSPLLAETLDVAATVFVDAALPGDGPDAAMAPGPLLAALRRLAGPDGELPPWTRWWDEADLTGLFPSEDARREIEQSEPRLPLSYFTARLRVPSGWAQRPCAYLAFGGTYAEEIEFAHVRGWPVAGLPGGHLHMLHDPAAVGAEVLQLEARLLAL